VWRDLEQSATAPLEAVLPPVDTATARDWPPRGPAPARTRRLGKLAIGSAPPDAWGRVGAIVNQHLRIGRIIGLGPHGTVYEADDLADARKVAVKVLHARLAPEGAATEGEVRLAPVFGHPALIELDALGRLDDGAWYLVSELVTGTDLRTLVAGGPLDEPRALRLVRGALAGLEPAHRAAAAHGDLKPENVIVLEGDEVRVLDLALARLFRRGATSDIAREDSPYVAPEVASTGVATPRGDVFALGAILAELLGVERDTADAVSRETGFLLWRATQPDPRDRFRDATEMRAAIDVALRVLA
jgi:serine/threonine protein kinase